MTTAISISLSGLQSASQRLNDAAAVITKSGDPKLSEKVAPPQPGIEGGGDRGNSGRPVAAGSISTDDLTSGLIDLKLAEFSYKASARVLKIANEIEGYLIDQFK